MTIEYIINYYVERTLLQLEESFDKEGYDHFTYSVIKGHDNPLIQGVAVNSRNNTHNARSILFRITPIGHDYVYVSLDGRYELLVTPHENLEKKLNELVQMRVRWS